MKKTITLLGMLLAFFATAGAQTVVKYYSSTATPYANLVSGKSYAILVAADKNCVDGDADYTTAKFLSWASLDGGKATTDAYTSTNDLRGKAEQNGYTWVVTVNSENNTITLKTGNNKYVSASSNGEGGGLSETAGELTHVDKGDWCLLTNGTYDNKTCYLTLGGDKRKSSRNKLEYWRYDANPTNGEIAKFKFFELIEGDVAITYNYTINGTKVGTYSFTAVSGMAYPTPGNLPDFVTATAPEGTVTEATTKNVEVNISNYPFKFSLNESETPEWGYLTGNISTADRKILTNGATSIARSAANAAYQNSTLNGVADDLWRMVGNPFSGFKVMNKSGKCLVKAASGNGATYTDASATASDNLWKVYGGDIIGQPNNITDANKEELKAKAFVLRHSTVGEGNNYLNPGGVGENTVNIGVFQNKSNGSCFLFLEPEFTVNLNTNDNLVASFATLALPFDFKVASSNTNDAKLYSGAYNASTGTLDMTAVEGVVPANAGVVIKSDNKAANIVLTANAKSTATVLTGNQLVGTTEEIAFSELTDKLVFGVTTQNHVGFYTAGGSAALPANRAYLPTSVLGGENAVAMNFGGDVTGINAVVKADKANAAIYDLTGRRVTRTVKGGLYIQNGSKFVAR